MVSFKSISSSFSSLPSSLSLSYSSTSSSAVRTLSVMNLIAYLVNVGIVFGLPAVTNLPDNGQVSQTYQTLVTPAGWAFAIWGLIFASQGVWSILQVVQWPRHNFHSPTLVTHVVAYNFIAVCVFQIAWTVAFALEQITVSMICMTGILYFLGRIFQAKRQRRQQNESQTTQQMDNEVHNNLDYFLMLFPFDLHLGWIIAATLVNANVLLVAYEASAPTQYTAAGLSILVAFFVALSFLFLPKQPQRQVQQQQQQQQQSRVQTVHKPHVVVPLVLVWALAAIAAELYNPKVSIGIAFTAEEIENIRTCAGLMALSVFFLTIMLWSSTDIVGFVSQKHTTASKNGAETISSTRKDEKGVDHLPKKID